VGVNTRLNHGALYGHCREEAGNKDNEDWLDCLVTEKLINERG